MFCIELIGYLGEIMNGTSINGKSFIFKIIDIDKEISFESVLFVHPSVNSFLTLENEDYSEHNVVLLDKILSQYDIKDLLEYKENEDN